MAEPVSFIVGFHEGTDASKVKTDLENLASDLTYKYTSSRLSYMMCETSQQTYERVFNAKLKYLTYTVNKGMRQEQTVSNWSEEVRATVPASVQGVEYVHLSYKMHPC